MIKAIGTATTALALAATLGAANRADAATFAAAYTCSVPILGARPVTIHGRLSATPTQAAVNQPIRFQLHITRLSLQSPVAIDSWTAVAAIDATGPHGTGGTFRMAGSGGAVSPRQPVTGDLYGTWTPRARGNVRLRGGPVTLTARVARVGVLTASCQPTSPRPVLETVQILSNRILRTTET